MTTLKRIATLVTIDLSIIWFSVYTSYLFRFSGNIPPEYLEQCFVYGVVSTVFGISGMYFFKLYSRVWQYASVGEMVSILKAVLVSSVLSYAAAYLLSGKPVPLSVFLRTFETILLLMGGARFAWRILRDTYDWSTRSQRRALIVGAGNCGAIIAKELKHNPIAGMRPAAFIDDDILKHRQRILGIPVYGGRDQIPTAVESMNITDIIIAMPSVSRTEISKIIEICKRTKAKLKIIPGFEDLLHDRVSIQHIREVQVEDLLGRDPVKLDLQGIAKYIQGQTILITGAGGSIGSELCRQVSRYKPEKLLLLGHGENSIYAIETELKRSFPGLALQSIIADVQDRARMDQVFREHRPNIVFHAAAHKHVPLMENNPAEAVKNNVFGTKNVADCADRYGTDRFVLISTDKAVNPTSVMGTTKRIAEMYIQSLGQKSRTRFAAVRFGNVLGSRGSVIPRFKEQIAAGGPVTVTHPEMVRYFMTIPEAVQLVIQAGALSDGGEVFVLDMGQPVKILDLAKDLIKLSGFEPGVDIKIEYTGLRPGEKLYEELLTNEEGLTSTVHDRIFIGRPAQLSYSDMEFEMKKLEKVLDGNDKNIREVLQHLVPTYTVPDYESHIYEPLKPKHVLTL